MWENTPLRSADSGLCCESPLEPGTSLLEPLAPDAWMPAIMAQLEPEDRLGSLVVLEGPPQFGTGTEHGPWRRKRQRSWRGWTEPWEVCSWGGSQPVRPLDLTGPESQFPSVFCNRLILGTR